MHHIFKTMLTCTALLALPASYAADVKAKPVRDISKIEVREKVLEEAIASRTLTWLTGSAANNDYMSVGRMANYFGFVGFRVASGHSLSRSAVAKQTLAVLTASQQQLLVRLLEEQTLPFERAQQARFSINRALEELLVGESVSEANFLALGREYGASEAALGRVIGQRFGEIAQTLSAAQRDELSDIRAAHISGRGADIPSKGSKIKLGKEEKKELVNLAARFLTWTTGTQEFNDFEVVGKPSQHFGFVSLRMASNHGVKRGSVAQEVLAMLTPQQRSIIQVAARQNVDDFKHFLDARSALMRVLEMALLGQTIDEALVQKYGREVGGVEARMTWTQANAMLAVRNQFSDQQASELLTIRNKYTVAIQDNAEYAPLERGRQLYSQCVLCHDVSSKQSIGPDLTDIVGRRVASDTQFPRYSIALKSFAKREPVWSVEILDAFIASPKDLVPGTYMGFSGLENKKERSALIQYLAQRSQ
ncbi:hypothetical protein BCU70_07630 [Vibrio sp. 10N.286.49.C2]|uniref:c-type cytochrome n=1 Tax=unclassified Vibrio TaxID=2614977 RepID=UPI000C82158C|nr:MULTISPECIES: hypothetical protein [unclassified Vibrio]PMH29510.1 hypothetical protein BCU70_07630 [Vibrio sp. 10N.286.49.C2]PMH56025.1 hypothetical protein BCU66_07540 [Vibrio sp. 10N.286.49.B1]PMH80134.1 hypothetical protein BCU58_03965 [Vibrio sp. 10N.286.48.B7]